MTDALSESCLSGSVKQEDLMVCVSKGYMLAQKKLNSNYKISIKEYLVSSQNKWNLSKFRKCYPELDNGNEGEINFIDCTTKVVNDRNKLLESVFLCNFNKIACEFKYSSIIDLSGIK
ncbi:hypothetical protein HYE53_02915 [Aggregatibacter actinomycetemcomitans]|uniref:lysozyme inhibitor LprI family protein n=1 Tax=Aggregatibacter actinomycetemcomitans TaxID=714 RepID=UPI00197B59B8|nr:lysozyme inhibitor LprI family protein [Aggregatibacter actinomycetemcomitans]MBN6070079.1 hypothetical protein [Aggregatibacter actinomycetemcomitans]